MRKKKIGLLIIAIAMVFILSACEGAGGVLDDINDGIEDTVITSIDVDGNNYNVDYGTTGQDVIDIHLPDTTLITFSNDTQETYDLDWQIPNNYNGETPDIYTFVADIDGLSSTQAEVTVTVKEMAPVEILDSNITENTVLTADKRYKVVTSISVSATLEIEPGTVIEFEENTNMRFGDGSIIKADGTEDNRILFTGTEKERGWWDGIQVRNTLSSENIMNFVIIEYGGGDNFESNVSPANLVVGGRVSGSNARLKLTNSILRESAGFGLENRQESNLTGFNDNHLTRNAEGAAKFRGNTIHYLDSQTDYAGNDHDFILAVDISLGNLIDVSDQRTWNALNVPYRVDGLWSIDKTEITILGGAEFEFTAGSGIRFREDSTIIADGSIDENETERSQPEAILFTGVEKSRGFWQGIQVRSKSSNNRMVHVTIEYGGGGTFGETINNTANLMIGGRQAQHYGHLQLVNSTLRESAGYGLNIKHNSIMNFSSNNTFTSNQEGPATMKLSTIHYLDSNSDYLGNDNNFIDVRNTSSGDVINSSDERTWRKTNAPYRIKGRLSISNSTINIDPGVEFTFGSDAGLRFMENSKIIAEGTEDNKIVFTGEQNLTGYWRGIQIRSLEDNIINHAVIAYGGSGTFESNLEEVNLVVGGRITEGRLTLNNTELNNSRGFGLEVRSDSYINTDFETANTFNANQEGNFKIDPDAILQ